MLERTGDLIPVLPRAAGIPWTRRRSQILNFLHRGPVTFATLVYDTNVGDISSLACYFNQERISVEELNTRFGHYPSSSGEAGPVEEAKVIKGETVTMPRLLLYPERPGPAHSYTLLQDSKWPAQEVKEVDLEETQVSAKRTLDWVMSQKVKSKLGWLEQERRSPVSTESDTSEPPLHSPTLLETSCSHSCRASKQKEDIEPCLEQAMEVVTKPLSERPWTSSPETTETW